MTPPATTATPLKLHFGCGDVHLPGYVGVDVRPCRGAQRIAPAWQPDLYPADSVAEIYSRHMLEHLDPNAARRTLTVWLNYLVPGGLLRLIVPDLAFHCRQLLGAATSWTDNPQANHEHALAGFYGWRDETRGGDREDAHRWGYTEAMLTALLREVGFQHPTRINHGVDSEPWHLHLHAWKPEGDGCRA